MGFRWLVNAGLLALPIGTTVGVLMGVDMHRSTSGQEPLFNPGTGSGGTNNPATGGGNGNPRNDKISVKQYCDLQLAIDPPSSGVKYILNPNQWGYTVGEPGAMCMNVTSFNNGSYPTAATAPEFFVTWQYPQGPETQPVHAFPNIQVDRILPEKASNIKSIGIAMEWTYGMGNEPVAKTDEAELTKFNVNTNVAIDMFLDADKKNSLNNSKAEYEVMVWFADFGPAAQPIGLINKTVSTESINGTTFDLYTGKNGFGQTVLTWMADATTEVFHGDIFPLLSKLTTIAKVDFPLDTLYLGHLGFGTEAFYADANVTFSMPTLAIDIAV